MDILTAFGLVAVSAMLICYAFEDGSAWWTLGFAAACALGSTYGFLQGTWPFGVVEAIWCLVAINRWRVQTVATQSISRLNGPGQAATHRKMRAGGSTGKYRL
jgi:hypothetical protein